LDTDGALVVGLLGCGVVGSGVADRLLHGFPVCSTPVRLAYVLVRDLSRPRSPTSVHSHLTTLVDQVLNDPKVDVIVECIGGLEPAARYVEAALRRGVPVISANKALIAERGERLEAVARQYRTTLKYEAAVGGAIPVLRMLRHLASADEILAVGGVINSTTNHVLSQMEDGLSMNEAVRAAQSVGYAEADPISDLDGIDAAQKLTILVALAFGTWLPWNSIARCGIRQVSVDDIAAARRLGTRVKLVASARREAGNIAATVGPTNVPLNHPFAAPRDAENAFLIATRHAGSIVIAGSGAGREATAAAIMGDLHDVLRSATLTSSKETIHA
jgi:homoserine dehydrogenase